tara:strand:- start:319 stop:1047 length:729 start_codon:yes stop_codon:yes gene_type:complete
MENCSTKYEIHAPAKLTLSLAIKGVHQSGLHELEAEMVTIDLQDTLRLREGDIEVTYQGAYPITPSPNDDLIVRALNTVGLSMKVNVDKKIPPGGGLGGGSANAAAILRWANFEDEKKAVHLGSDVPFNIRGGRASVSGVGESITYLPYEEKTFTLILPPFGCSTAAVYKRWDEMGGPKSPNGNDLEPAAIDVYPELQKWKEILEEHSQKEARLAGSGSTWFVEGNYPAEGLIVATTTKENF